MSTAAEIAAGQAIYALDRGLYGQEWYELSDEQRAHYVERGVAAVRAYERASWRPIAPDDSTDKSFLMSYPHKGGGWAEPYECKLWQLGEPRYKPEMLRIRDMPEGPEA